MKHLQITHTHTFTFATKKFSLLHVEAGALRPATFQTRLRLGDLSFASDSQLGSVGTGLPGGQGGEDRRIGLLCRF